MTTQPQSIPPLVCTLADLEELSGRHLAWTDVEPLAISRRRIEGGIELTFAIELAETIEDLAAIETDCCGTWLNITTARHGELLHLRMTTTNPDGVATIVAIAKLDKAADGN